jgi:hypothetical protein
MSGAAGLFTHDSKAQHSYCFYGARLRSDWALPYGTRSFPCFIEIDLVDGSSQAHTAAFDEAAHTETDDTRSAWFRYAQLGGGAVYLRWSQLVEFLVSADGREIAVRRCASASAEAFYTYMLGQALSFALIKQGFEPLHATVVLVDGQAVAFLGECGRGKSSIAAAFLQAGHRLLTDDQLVLTNHDRVWTAHPGPPRIKLFPEIAERFLGARAAGTPITHLSRKLSMPLDHRQTSSTAVPLKAVYVLAAPRAEPRSGRIAMRRLSPRRACVALLRHTFNSRVVDTDRLQRQFALATGVAAAVPVKLLSYPRDLSLLASVRDAVVADLAR